MNGRTIWISEQLLDEILDAVGDEFGVDTGVMSEHRFEQARKRVWAVLVSTSIPTEEGGAA